MEIPFNQPQNNFNKEVFERELSLLNPEQKLAVETIEGPVLVIAGPGTGKTQILAARIGYILENTDANPENILCLTYTDAGTVAMRKRLLKFIGPDAYRVTISTFHAFCNTVIQDNLDIFGMRSLDPISELEEVELLRKLIDGFGSKHPLKRWVGDNYFEEKRLKELFHIMKTEDWTPEYICQKADEYLADLPNREDYIYKTSSAKYGYKKGDLNKRKITERTEKMEVLKAAALEFPKYRQMMQERRRYDYDDMILWVLNEFKKNPDLLLNYQERYQYFLVDEYQDTNGAQNEILEQLISYWDVPNVFVVGDDDQSIYRFQGANVENILKFRNTYEDSVKVVVIKENYRSSQNILDAAKSLISKNRERLIKVIPGLSKDLVAQNEAFAGSAVKPEIRSCYNSIHETMHIAREIETLFEKGADLSEVAVIYRNHRQCEDLARYLESKKIPLNIKRKANILDSVFIKKLLVILEYIEGESKFPHSREHLLFDILHFDFFSIEPLAVANLAVELRNKKGEKQRIYWREHLRNVLKHTEVNLFSAGENKDLLNVKRLSDDLEYWIGATRNTTLQTLLEKIITRGGLLAYVMKSPEKIWLMQEITTFFEFVKNESARNPRVTVSDLIKTLDLMKQHELSLPISKTSFAEKGVNFVTAHSSKGLEFEYVFLMGCTKDTWDKGPRKGTFSFPDNIVTRLEGDDVEESRRLFYVALTRAKQYLFVSYPAADKEMREMEKSRFVAEMAEGMGIEEKFVHLPDDFLAEYNMQVMQEQEIPDLKMIEEIRLKKLLENYSLSVTHLNVYLKCPISFYFRYVLRVPTAKSQHLAFGSAVHLALEQFFKKMQDGNRTFPPVSELLRDFEWNMRRQEDAFTEDQFRNRMDYGREILPKYYEHYVNTWNKIVSVERNIRGVEIQGVPVNGKLDKIEFDGKNAVVVDYKTGQFSNAKNKLAGPLNPQIMENASFEENYGGDYWRQAVFYRLIVDSDPSLDWNVVSTEFDFIQPDDKGRFQKHQVMVSENDLETVKNQITDSYKCINNFEFNRGCGDQYCEWCHFVKSHYKEMIGETEGAEL